LFKTNLSINEELIMQSGQIKTVLNAFFTMFEKRNQLLKPT